MNITEVAQLIDKYTCEVQTLQNTLGVANIQNRGAQCMMLWFAIQCVLHTESLLPDMYKLISHYLSDTIKPNASA